MDVEKLESNSGTATYPEIKEYVKEKFGIEVSSLYIAQIKNKVGIKDRRNYNIGNGKSKVPICPPYKEEAIMDLCGLDSHRITAGEKAKLLVDRSALKAAFEGVGL